MSHMNQKTLLEWALDYHKRGLCVIPIGFDKKPPRGFKWEKYQIARPTEADLQEWFGSGKYKNLAVVAGKVSGGLTILDVDLMELYEKWREQNPGLAEKLPTAETSRGRHVYFRSELDKSKKYGKIDLISERKYALLPPSIHGDGSEYRWIIPLPANVSELPLLDPSEWGLEKFTEETEDREDPEDRKDVKDTERHRSHKGEEGCLDYLDKELKKEVEKAIDATLPQKQGQRNDAVFPLCQWLKGIPELRDLPAREHKPIVKEWHGRAYDVIGTKPFTDTWKDFVHAWKRVKWPKGNVMLSQAVKKALRAEAVLPEAEEYDIPEARLLLRVCYELQQGMGDKPFFLASRIAGGIIGVSHRTAYKLLEMFVEDGKLQVIEEYTKKKATRFRYIAN